MDPRTGGPIAENPRPVDTTRRGQSNSQSVVAENTDNATRAGDSLRRGNSDGDVLARSATRFREQLPGDGETWMDFLRYSGTNGENREQAQIAVRRAATMATDGNRRLAVYAQDDTRRRSSSHLPFPSGRPRDSIPHTNFNTALSVLGNGNGPHTGRILDRTLPRRPSGGLQYNRQGPEIILPKWQPDNEVTKCPICNTAFSFWYRKHHCRKCGRVVCANCSPHRITIPRQFIVHPPEDGTSSGHPRMDGVEVVDLTGEDENSPSLSHQRTGNGRERGLDPALGGGQEVRLCNPCVPDPNPLPHLDHASPKFTLDSFPRPESIPQLPSSSLVPPRNSSFQRPAPLPPRRGSTSRQNHENRSPFLLESRGERLIDGANPIPEFARDHQRIRGSQSSATSANLSDHLSTSSSGPDSSLNNVGKPSRSFRKVTKLMTAQPHRNTQRTKVIVSSASTTCFNRPYSRPFASPIHLR